MIDKAVSSMPKSLNFDCHSNQVVRVASIEVDDPIKKFHWKKGMIAHIFSNSHNNIFGAVKIFGFKL